MHQNLLQDVIIKVSEGLRRQTGKQVAHENNRKIVEEMENWKDLPRRNYSLAEWLTGAVAGGLHKRTRRPLQMAEIKKQQRKQHEEIKEGETSEKLLRIVDK